MRMTIHVAIAALLAAPATAQQPAAITEQSLERGLTNLGLMAAHALQCTPEPDRPATRQRLLAFHSGLVAEMGSNAAFRFAIAFGAGATHDVDRNSCDAASPTGAGSCSSTGSTARACREDKAMPKVVPLATAIAAGARAGPAAPPGQATAGMPIAPSGLTVPWPARRQRRPGRLISPARDHRNRGGRGRPGRHGAGASAHHHAQPPTVANNYYGR